MARTILGDVTRVLAAHAPNTDVLVEETSWLKGRGHLTSPGEGFGKIENLFAAAVSDQLYAAP